MKSSRVPTQRERKIEAWIKSNHNRTSEPDSKWRPGQSQVVSYNKRGDWQAFSEFSIRQLLASAMVAIVGILITARLTCAIVGLVIALNG